MILSSGTRRSGLARCAQGLCGAPQSGGRISLTLDPLPLPPSPCKTPGGPAWRLAILTSTCQVQGPSGTNAALHFKPLVPRRGKAEGRRGAGAEGSQQSWGGGAEEPGPSLSRSGGPCVRESVCVRHHGQALSWKRGTPPKSPRHGPALWSFHPAVGTLNQQITSHQSLESKHRHNASEDKQAAVGKRQGRLQGGLAPVSPGVSQGQTRAIADKRSQSQAKATRRHREQTRGTGGGGGEGGRHGRRGSTGYGGKLDFRWRTLYSVYKCRTTALYA